MEPPVEDPVLAFEEYAVAFHLAAERTGEGDRTADEADEESGEEKKRRERAMRSFEDDMLLYAHRDSPPFFTRVVPASIETVSVHFAPEVAYESEGVRMTMRCAGATEDGRTRTFELSLGETEFLVKGEIGVLSLVLTPLDPPDELNEYDLIKLAKLWEGGEGVEAEPSAIEEGRDVWFSTEKQPRATLHDLVGELFPTWGPLRSDEEPTDLATTEARGAFRVGTLELTLPAGESTRELFRDLAILRSRRQAPKVDSPRWNRAVAVGGILQGLLDFQRIEDYELADVFAEVDVDAEDETMIAFHKGTLLSLAGADPEDDASAEEEAERVPPIGVDPYLAVPNIVLLHDEQRLKTARLEERRLASRQSAPRWPPLRRWKELESIEDSQNGLGELAGLLSQHLPNVFHYPSERRLQDQGRQSRGLDDLEVFIRQRMEDLSSVLEARVRKRDRWTIIVGIAISVVTGFLVQRAIEVQGWGIWVIVLVAVGLFAGFLLLRDKLF